MPHEPLQEQTEPSKAQNCLLSGMAPNLRAASGGELRRGESIEGIYKAYTEIGLRLYTRYIKAYVKFPPW